MAYQNAIQFWREFDVPSLQRQLDEEAANVARRQDDSDASVKKLVELSRDFKRNSTEEVRKTVSPLLRSFQSEIDSLTKRANASETTFLNTYKKFIEIPDPIPLLEQALSQQQRLNAMQDLEVENSKLRETLDEYTKEFAQVKNQEATITKLRNQIRELENKAEERASVKANEYETQLYEAFKEKEKEMDERVAMATTKMEEAVSKRSVLQSALDSTQLELFELKNRLDDDSSARAAELDILVTDLDRANQRALTAERELDKLKRSQTTTLTDPHLKSSVDTTELELELQAKDKELSCVLDDVERLQKSLNVLKENSSKHIMLLESQLKEKESKLRDFEQTLEHQKDYEEIKKEINILRSVEFSSSTHEAIPTSLTKPLEVLLLEKNRGLVNENTSLKTELSELRGHFVTVQTQYKESLQTLQDQTSLITQLESDLTRIQPYLPPRTEGEGQASPSDIIAEAVRDIHPERKSSEVGGSNESLLSIITSQRERFKQRNIELQTECQQQKQTVSILQREVDTLRGDNVKMYEKIRFLQSYPSQHKGGDDTTTSRYSNQYEAGLDPFAAFSAKERQRKYMQLSGPDKATLIMGRFILSNKIVRMGAFFYTIILHLIVMLLLAKLINTTDMQTVDLYSECAKKFTEHMSMFHPPNVEKVMETFHGGGGGVR